MIILAILASLAAICALCWLLFTLAVFALPAFVGVTVGAWAHGTGAGIVGAILIGLVVAAITLAIGHLLIAFVRPIWLKLAIAIAFVAPAALAGFHFHPRHRQTPHAVRRLADGLLGHRRDCRWHYRLRAGRGHGDGSCPIRSGPRAGLITFSADAADQNREGTKASVV